MQARLQITPVGNEPLPVGKAHTVLGSDRQCDVRLRGGGVEARHAEIVRQGAKFLLRDLKSRSGTYVNGQPIQEWELVGGDRIRLGRQRAELLFMADPAETARLPAASLRGMASLLESLRVMEPTSILEDVLDRVLDAALGMTGAERAFVLLPDSSGQLAHIVGRGPGGGSLPRSGSEISRIVPQRVFETGQSEQLSDLKESAVADAHRRTTDLGIRAVICVPLRVIRLGSQEGDDAGATQVLGVLYLDSARARQHLLSRPTLEALESLAAEASVTIDNADLYRKTLEARRTEEDLRRAHEVQEALLPQRIIRTSAFHAAGFSLPCRAIGGDFLDYFEFSDGRLGIAVGDVAGKGAPAAMLASYLQGLVTARVRDGDSPEQVLAEVNRNLLRHSLDYQFATFFYAVLSPDGSIAWCNAGHPHPMLLRGDGSIQRLGRGGLPLGAMEMAAYELGQTRLGSDDMLIVFSDGVSEAFNPSKGLFEEERLEECIRLHGPSDPEFLLDRVLKVLEAFTSGEPQSDDITLLVLRRDCHSNPERR